MAALTIVAHAFLNRRVAQLNVNKMPNPPGKPNPVYANYNSLKAELDAKCPLLELVTSEAEFQVLLQTRGNKGPSMIKIQMRNTDGKVEPGKEEQKRNQHEPVPK